MTHFETLSSYHSSELYQKDAFYTFLLGSRTSDTSLIKHLPRDIIETIYQKYLEKVKKPTMDVTSMSGYRELIWMNKNGQYHRDHDLPCIISCYLNGHVKRLSWYTNGEQKRFDTNLPIDVWYDEIGQIVLKRWYTFRHSVKPITIMRNEIDGKYTCSFYEKECEKHNTYESIPHIYLS